MNLSNLKVLANAKTTKILAKVKRYSPEIMIAGGIVCVVAGTVEACKATIKAEEVLDKHNHDIEVIREAKANLDDGTFPATVYSEEDYKKDVAITYAKTTVNLVKTYSKAIILTGTGIGLFLTAHNVMSKRAMALATAYNLLENEFKNYRDNVVNEFGEEVDKKLRYSLFDNKEETEENNENENENVKEKPNKKDTLGYSDYAKCFDESNVNWKKNAELNLIFLKAQERYANDKLEAQGFIFLNDVYELLDIPKTKVGQLVGWMRNSENGDGYVDFNIYDIYNDAKRSFVNGGEPRIWLDFNVDGVIYDKI